MDDGLNVFSESGHGYWVEGFGCIRASSGFNDGNTSHAIVIKKDCPVPVSLDCAITERNEMHNLNEYSNVILGCDMYNFQITGDVACNINANSGLSANHAGPTILVLNDQGGQSMNVSDKPYTLRAQMKHHEPIVCFEPGIMSRDCSAGNRAYMDICSTLRAHMGDNQPAVCYAIGGTNTHYERR